MQRYCLKSGWQVIHGVWGAKSAKVGKENVSRACGWTRDHEMCHRGLGRKHKCEGAILAKGGGARKVRMVGRSSIGAHKGCSYCKRGTQQESPTHGAMLCQPGACLTCCASKASINQSVNQSISQSIHCSALVPALLRILCASLAPTRPS